MRKQHSSHIASRTVRVSRVGVAALLIAITAVPGHAATSPLCAPRAELLKQLSARYKEAPVAVGLSNSGALVEVLTSEQGSTWTIMISQPNGASCLVAAGEGWEELKRIASNDHGA
jgi:hypothetical protein